MLATPEALTNITRYVLDAGLSGDFLDLLAALMPCVLGYGEIGSRLAAEAAPDTPYRDWIDTYAGPEYQAACHSAGELLDRAIAKRLGDAPQSSPRWATLGNRFATATPAGRLLGPWPGMSVIASLSGRAWVGDQPAIRPRRSGARQRGWTCLLGLGRRQIDDPAADRGAGNRRPLSRPGRMPPTCRADGTGSGADPMARRDGQRHPWRAAARRTSHIFHAQISRGRRTDPIKGSARRGAEPPADYFPHAPMP